MEDKLEELSGNVEKLSESLKDMKGMMAQVREGIMGNPVAGDKGLSGRLAKLEEKMETYERWKWWVIGAASTIGFSLNELFETILTK
ncbi:hypothetical protein [Chitinophaga rhizosphaerae]|uniref:hypothetical protein n=1 Tax=Chitinophaga rhizosphaerae TaxID=1864947 RepID=UPI000F804079|nr:hypothetical protein [Chitinophaga rhizosphaerae]